MSIFASVKSMFTSTPEPAPKPKPAPRRTGNRGGNRANRMRPGAREQVADLYRRGYPVARIAEYAGVSSARVYQVLHDEGVILRKRGRNAEERRRAKALPPL